MKSGFKKLFGTLLTVALALLLAGNSFAGLGQALTTTRNGVAYETTGSKIDYLGLSNPMVITSCAYTSVLSSSIVVADLIGWSTDIFSASGVTPATGMYYLQCVAVDDADADTEYVGQYRIIQSLTSATGTVVVIPAFTNAAASGTLDAGDFVCIKEFSDLNPQPSFLFHGWTTTSETPATTTLTFPALIGKPGSILVDATAKCINDLSAATNDGLTATVSAFDPVTGIVTTSAFSTNVAAGDEFIISWTPAGEFINGAKGFAAGVTAAGVQPGTAASNLQEYEAWLGNTQWRYSYTANFTGTSSATDTCQAFVVSGGAIIVSGLSFQIQTAASQSDVILFSIKGHGAAPTKLGLGKDINAMAAGVTEFLNPIGGNLGVLTDSLGYTPVLGTTSFIEAKTYNYEIRVPSGATIQFAMPGTNAAATAVLKARLKWRPEDPAAGAVVTPYTGA